MEIVIIEDLVASYRTNWVRIAKTTDADALHIGHVLRRRGNGSGSEELEVEAISDGRVFLKRGHGPTPVEVHFHGSVFTVLTTHVPPERYFRDGDGNPIPPPDASLADRRRANLALARQRKAEKKAEGAAV